jgi:hypothetical protein
MQTRTLATLLALLLALVPLAVACGGDDGDAGEAAASVETAIDDSLDDDTEDALRAEADRLEKVVDDQVSALGDATSVDDVEQQVADARAELEASAERLDGLDLEPEDEQIRDDLKAAVQRLEGELADVQAAAEDGDLPRALSAASSLSLDELEAEIDRAAR